MSRGGVSEGHWEEQLVEDYSRRGGLKLKQVWVSGRRPKAEEGHWEEQLVEDYSRRGSGWKLEKVWVSRPRPEAARARSSSSEGVRRMSSEGHWEEQLVETDPKYDLKEPKDLARYLVGSDIKPIRAEYLTHLVLTNERMPRRQEAEQQNFTDVTGRSQSALVSHEEVKAWASGSRAAIICSVSHVWESREHPDPLGYQLEQIASHASLFSAAFLADVWVYFDYTSLFQFKRNSVQEESFRKALQSEYALYAHESTLTFRVESLSPEDVWQKMEDDLVTVYHEPSDTVKPVPLKDLVANRLPFGDRGCCCTEVQFSCMRSDTAQNQWIDAEGNPGTPGDTPHGGLNGLNGLKGKAPTLPDQFIHEMETAKWTRPQDKEPLMVLHKKLFEEKARDCTEWIVEGLPAKEMQALGQALPYFKSLNSMSLKNFWCCKEEAKAFAKALATTPITKFKCCAEDPDSLHCLIKALLAVLNNMDIALLDLSRPDSGWAKLRTADVEALAGMLKTNKRLTHLDLSRLQLRDEAVKALAEMLTANRSITHLDLRGTFFSDAGVKALLSGLDENRTLTNLQLDDAGVSEELAEALAPALATIAKRKINNGLEGLESVIARLKDAPKGASADATNSLANSEAPAAPVEVPRPVVAARYDLKEPHAFAQFLQDADIRLIRAGYLNDLARSKRLLPRRQEAEFETFVFDGKAESALVSHEEVQNWAAGARTTIICSVSHAWEAMEHPDPCRYQLELLADRAAWCEASFKTDVWIFYDYVSLFQYERLFTEEERSFKAAMDNLHVMYSHECTMTFIIETLTPDAVWNLTMADEQSRIPVWDHDRKSIREKPLKDLLPNRNVSLLRGSVILEISWSSLRTHNSQTQRIDIDWLGSDQVEPRQGQGLTGKVPVTPAKFIEAMESVMLTDRADAKTFISLQQKIFEEKVAVCEDLVLKGLPVQELFALADALPLYKSLKILKLVDFECNEEGAEVLGKALARSKVVSLTLVKPRPGSNDFMGKAVVDALRTNQTLTDIKAPDFDSAAKKAVEQALRKNRSMKARPFEEPARFETLVADLKRNQTLRIVDLSCCQITEHGAKVLAQMLRVNKTITEIKLNYCGIGLEGIKALAEALKMNQIVAAAALRGNNLGDEGAEAMAEALKANKTIKKIIMSKTEIGDKGAQALAEALQINETVEEFDLCRCNFGVPGAKALAMAFRNRGFINVLNLDDCPIGDGGVEAISEMLPQCRVLSLSLRRTHLGDTGVKAFARQSVRPSSPHVL